MKAPLFLPVSKRESGERGLISLKQGFFSARSARGIRGPLVLPWNGAHP